MFKRIGATHMTVNPYQMAPSDDDRLYEEVGRALRRRRKELGLSLRAIAAAVDLSPPMVLKYEGGAKVSAATLVRMASALKCLPSELLNIPDPHEHAEIRRLVSSWSQLPSEGARAAFIDLVERLAMDTRSPPEFVLPPY